MPVSAPAAVLLFEAAACFWAETLPLPAFAPFFDPECALALPEAVPDDEPADEPLEPDPLGLLDAEPEPDEERVEEPLPLGALDWGAELLGAAEGDLGAATEGTLGT